MKKFFTAVVCVLVLALTLTAFVACNPTEDPVTPPAGGGDTITVTWYQGSKVLKEETLAKGSKATAWTPEAPQDKEFTGWFAEASLTQAFDFDAELNEDTDIFAKFTSTEFEADENAYYLIGAGAGDMGKANWDHTAAAANLTMTKTDNATANIYEITITMYAGDMFQICHDGSWDGQVGIGYVEGAGYGNQTEKTEYLLFMMCTLLPTVTSVFGLIPKFFYDLSGEKKERMYRELAERRQSVIDEMKELEASKETGGSQA